jgi:hypothetical protein
MLAIAAVPAQAAEIQTTGHPIEATIVSVQTILYEPGSASAIRPAIDPITDKVTWKCVFAGWRSGVTVQWQCNLMNTAGLKLDGRSGTFGGGTYQTQTFSRTYQIGKAYCTEARALSVDGGDADTKCG